LGVMTNLLVAATVTIVFSTVGMILISGAAHGSPTAANIGAVLLLPILLLDRLGIVTIQLIPVFRPNAVVAIGGFFLIQLAYYALILFAFRRVLQFTLNSRQH
jgi:hypothetical protein